MTDETGRVEAAARALDNYCNCVFDPLWLSCPKCRVRAREALAAADRFDQEHGIARIKLDDDATLAAIADGLRHAGIEIGSVGGQDYRLYVASFVIGALREAANQ